jgi:hypothetical protein
MVGDPDPASGQFRKLAPVLEKSAEIRAGARKIAGNSHRELQK